MSLIEVQDLSFTYSGGTSFAKTAVDNISFSIEKGDFVGLIGHTGSGKSTLVQLLNGLLKPTSGKILLNGKNIWENPKKIRDVRFKVGMVFQYPEYQLFEDTVFKDISFGPRNMGLSEEEITKRVISASSFVGLKEDMLQKSPFEISGGEKRRVAIAGVIAMDPEVLILDEPTAGLDPVGKKLLLSQLSGYHRHKNNTVILVSHNMEDIADNTNKVMVLNKSKLVMMNDTKSVFSKVDILENMGLQAPQITKIMSVLRQRGYNLPDGILTVKQAIKEILYLLEGSR